MIGSGIYFRLLSLLALMALSSLSGFAQIEMQSFHRGEFKKVIQIWGTTYYVQTDGLKQEGDPQKIRFEKADSYLDGRVEVAFGEQYYEEDNAQKSRVAKKQFVMDLELTADRHFDKCFAVLLFSSNGSMSTFYKSLGSLRKDSKEKMRIRMPAHVDKLSSLHVFSHGDEVMTNQSKPDLTLEQEFALLDKDFKGVPLAAIYNNKRDYAHRLSPSGGYLATYRDMGTHYDLVLIETGELRIHDRVAIGRHDEWIEDPVWLDDETLLFIHDEKLKSYHVGNKGKIETVRKNIDEIVKAVGDGQNVIIYSDYSTRFIKYNFKTGKDESYYQWMVGTAGVWFDGDGDARVRRVYKNGRFRFDYRKDGKAGWDTIDSINREDGLGFDYGYSEMLDQDIFVESFSKEPNVLYILSTHESDTQGLYTYSLETGRIGELIYHDKDYDLGGEESRLLYGPDRNLLGISYWRERLVTKWFDPKFEHTQAIVDAALPDLMNRPIEWTEDGKTVVYYSFNEQNPGSYFLLQLETGKMRKIMDVQPQLRDYELAKTQAIKWKARDGAVINGYLTMPPGAEEGVPLIVKVHGGPKVRDTLEFSAINQFFATRGFGVLEVNYRGSDGYGVGFRNSALIGNLDTIPIDDVADGVLFLIDQGVVQKERVAILGGSWGGYSTYMSLIRHPDIYRCGVAYAAPTDMGLMLLTDRWTGNDGGRAFWGRILEADDLPEGYMARISPINRVEEFQDPILIGHGKYDWQVTIDQAKFMAKALEEAGKEYEFSIYPGVGHGYSKSSLNHYLNIAEAFIRKHMDL